MHLCALVVLPRDDSGSSETSTGTSVRILSQLAALPAAGLQAFDTKNVEGKWQGREGSRGEDVGWYLTRRIDVDEGCRCFEPVGRLLTQAVQVANLGFGSTIA